MMRTLSCLITRECFTALRGCRCPFKDFEVFQIYCKISEGVCKCTTLPLRLLLMLTGRHRYCDQQGSKENPVPREFIHKQEENKKLPAPAASFFNKVSSTDQILSDWYSFGPGKCSRKLCVALELTLTPEKPFYELITSLERKRAEQIEPFLHLLVREDFLSPLHSLQVLQLSRNVQTAIPLPLERKRCPESLPTL